MISKWIKCFSVILAALCLVVCIAGCDGGNGSSDSSSDSSGTEGEVKPPHKVGYIFHGKADDPTFSAEMNAQRILAANRSSMDTCYIDGVSITDFEAAVQKLVEAGCTDIVSGSSVFASKLSTISNRYMNINFIGYGMTGGGSNVSAYTELPYQGAYAGGIAAAYNSHTRNIGFVGDNDMLYVMPVANAAALGAQAVFSTAKLYVAGATRDNEIEDAIDDLLARNCDVIICYTNSTHAEDYCEEKGVKFVGCHDFSEKEADYTKMLMYFYAARDSYFLAQFKQMQLDTWTTGVYTGSMGNGIICISEALSANKDQGADKDKGLQQVLNTLVSKLSSGGEIFSGQLIDNKGVARYLQSDVMTEQQIFSMNWYVEGVTVVGNYRGPQYTLPDNPLEIKT